MPQIYNKELDNGFVELWKTDENLDSCRELAQRSGIIFPRGWQGWKNHTKQKQALLVRQICFNRLQQQEVYYEQNGKPFLACGRLSISHSQHYIAVYYHTHNEIGIDVEEPHKRIEKIGQRFLHPEEKKQHYSIEELTAIWSVKESVFKKFGGKTAFYSENIKVNLPALVPGNNQFTTRVDTETGPIEQKMEVLNENGFILAYTL